MSRKLKVHYELRFNKDIMKDLYGNTVVVKTAGEVYRSSDNIESLQRLKDFDGPICVEVHGHGAYSYCSGKDLDMYEVETLTIVTDSKL